MAKLLKNQTLSPIILADLGLDIPASPTVFTIHPNEYSLFAASSDLATQISSGNIIVNDGYDDLKTQFGLLHIFEESIPRQSSFIVTSAVQATAAATETLTDQSRLQWIFTGTTSGQILKLPSATTLQVGHRFQFWNKSTQTIAINNYNNTLVFTIPIGCKTWTTLQVNSTTNGTWLFETASNIPFDNSGNGFVATDVQTAIEESKAAIEGKISVLPTFLNNGLTKNKWLTLDGSMGPSNSLPAVTSFDSKFAGITYVNTNDNSNVDIEFYKNNILIFTWQIRDKRTAWKTNNLSGITFIRGDRISCFAKRVTGTSARDVLINLFVQSVNSQVGEGGTSVGV